ncbi:IclR family transcriptional regulator [Rhodovulum sp. DZ06]|uniref:IclR family transcriptional regulator n=1 Tax=Rhodovulum sp. DZ06 TaxID=3425126 RepID=UPI003D3302FC
MRDGARGIQSIEVSGRILRALVGESEPMMLKDLAKAAELAPAQCHAYLTSLRHVGLVQQDHDTGRYRMGRFAMRLGGAWLQSSPRPAAAIRLLRALTDELDAITILVAWGAMGPTIVHVNEGADPTALNLRQGALYPVTGAASGRIFGAFMPEAETAPRIARELEGYAPDAAAQMRARYEERRAAILRDGYDTADGAPIPDINAVSAPVFDEAGALDFVISVIGRRGKLDVGPDGPAATRLAEIARTVSGARSHAAAD